MISSAMWATLFTFPLLGVSSAPAHAQQQELLDRMDRRIEGAREELIAVRRDLHRHPEVSGQEERTASVVAARLQSLGLEIQTGVGGHGVVGILRGGRPGPVVAFRADMDAVYSGAPDPVPFASETPGVRHICGHDIHTTVALGIAEAMTAIRDELPGAVKFIFQPAEENVRGAGAMIADGVLEDPAPGSAVSRGWRFPASTGSPRPSKAKATSRGPHGDSCERSGSSVRPATRTRRRRISYSS
jgi:hypothetical protein